MADNIDIKDATGATKTVATDEQTINAIAAQVERTTDQGSTVVSTSQVTPTTTAATLIAARDTRKYVEFTNKGNVDCYIGPATVTTANGVILEVGYTRSWPTKALVQAIISTGTMTGAVHITECYDS